MMPLGLHKLNDMRFDQIYDTIIEFLIIFLSVSTEYYSPTLNNKSFKVVETYVL